MTDRAQGGVLGSLASAGFVLLAFVLAGPIAPMGIATAICGVFTVASMIAARPRTRWPRTPVDAAAIGWAVALLLATAFAVDRAGSAPRLTKAFFPLLVGLAAHHGADRRTASRALIAYFIGVVIASAYGVGVWVAHGAAYPVRARGFSGHYMTFAGQLLLALPVALGVVLRHRDLRWRIGSAVVAAAALVALAVTYTRSAWLGLFASCAVLLGASQPPLLALLAVVGVGAWFFAPGAFHERLHSAFDPWHPNNRERLHMWRAGLRMFRDHPITGVGLMDLHPLYDRYRDPEAVERVGHLHNSVVQVLATTGAIGLAMFAWLYVSLLRCATGVLRRVRGAAPARGLGAGVRLGVLASIAGFLLAGLFEWNFGDEELLYALFTLAGLAWAAREWPES